MTKEFFPTLPSGGTPLSLWLGALLSPQSLQVNSFIYRPVCVHSQDRLRFLNLVCRFWFLQHPALFSDFGET